MWRSILELVFVLRHLDSSSNERPDISSLQRRIKVPLPPTNSAYLIHTLFYILSFINCPQKCSTTVKDSTHTQNPQGTGCTLNIRHVFVSLAESDPWHGHVLRHDGKSVPQWIPTDAVCLAGDALRWPLRRLLHQPAVLPLQLPVQGGPRAGEALRLCVRLGW